MSITGWQAIVDVVRVRVDYDAGRPREARLILESAGSSALAPKSKTGDELGTLVFEQGSVSELRFGPGMPSRTHRESLHRSPP
jgi:hypothetical protein